MSEAVSRFAALDPCVHCGFCLPACPTYLATGDENDSPRGRIVLMRALERGEIAVDDPALRRHLDACLGCRGCEPACPSGVAYGRGLETAREELAAANGQRAMSRLALRVLGSRALSGAAFAVGRALRAGGIAHRLRTGGRLGQMMGMLEATRPPAAAASASARAEADPTDRGEAVLFSGCVMSALFRHVNEASARTLQANGYRITTVWGAPCCGAPHAHAGATASARGLARRNLAALRLTRGPIAVDSAGCGAALKDYGHLMGTAEAAALSSRVRDVTELLAETGPRRGGVLPLRVAYDPPCHLQHAQGVHRQALAVLDAIPGLRWRLLPGAEQCCGSAGLYNLVQPEMATAVLDRKLDAIADAADSLDAVLTGNPGCIMQIGSGLRRRGIALPVLHPVQLLDRSYRAAASPEPDA